MIRSKLICITLLVIVSTLLVQNVLAADGYWVFDNITRDQGGSNDVSTIWKTISDTSVAGKATWKCDPSPNACCQTIESIFSWNVPETMETGKPFNLTVKLEQIKNNNCILVFSWLKMWIGVTDSTTNSDGPDIGFRTGNGLVGEKTSEVYGPIHYPNGRSYILVRCFMSAAEWYEVKYWYKWVEGTLPENVEPVPPSVILASTWIVKEYGPMGNYDGVWTRRPGTNTFDASWSGGSITDVIDITSVEGNKIILHRHGNNGDYMGTISPDGTSISGTASWYVPGEEWSVSV
jgi:hypothetical protein